MAVEGVVLAAGYSSRVGANKLLLDLGGKSVLERCLENMSSVCTRIILVGGHRFNELQSIFKPSANLTVVFNQSYPEGMFSSVQKGISQLREEKFFICPGDYPLVQRQTYSDLLSAEGSIVVPTYGKRPGHPVLISSFFIPEIRAGGYACLRDFIRANNPIYLDTEDAGVHMDIDTWQDYENMVRHFYRDKNNRGGNINDQYLGRNNSFIHCGTRCDLDNRN